MSDRPPRLLVVSAHFPPDFVSGGTLVPDREARRLAERGWDVSVYAGSLDATRPPLSAWDEDVDGLAVRWIAIERFVGWGDRNNFDNRGVVADFRRHLAERRPDLVHLHSLQSLGGGLLAAARDAGARTVVTMHDFWWVCARQFLVDREWVPCSLVVDAGACQCEVDRPWLDARNQWLRGQLVHADLVLAPSEVAAEVLAANGLAADRLLVDENGLDDVPPMPSPRPPPTGEVVFRYAGGPNPMKGSVVLAEAARLLAARCPTGWRLEVHAEAHGFSTEAGALPAAVQIVPPYAPGQPDAVLAVTDVLVVPSLMRESHSLLTREALLRGVPVVTSDSLGPEDAVESGRNGLVVPTGDADALADALASVVHDPATVARWSVPATTVSVRRAADQIEQLDATLRRFVAALPTARRATPDIQRVLFVVGIDGAPLRYRAHLPAEALALHGVHTDVRHYRDPSVRELAAKADAVVVYRVPATVQVLALLDDLGQTRPEVPRVFDVDDLIFDPDLADEIPALQVLPEDEAALWLDGVRRYRTTMEACDAFVGSTALLCDHATSVVGLPAHRFANGVGALLARRADLAVRRPRTPGPLRVGYFSGTTTHDRDWAEVEAVVLDVLEAHPDVELWLGGHLNPSPAVERLGPRLYRLPMLDWRDLPATLRDLDVNLAPLEALGRFNEAKSAIKWLEAALCATPTIASPTQPFGEVIEPGNGFLAGTAAEWRAALEALLTDHGLRARVGARARRDALLTLSPHLQADRYLAILDAVRRQVAAGRTAREPGITPVAPDEPWSPSPLEPYTDVVPRPARARRLRPLAGRVKRRLRGMIRPH